MKVTGSTIQQLDKSKSASRCRKWRLWATTDHGRKSRRFNGTYTMAQEALKAFVAELENVVPNSDTFGAYAESWRMWRKSLGEHAPGTYENDRRNVTALCRTQLADMRMDEITPDACREALIWLKQNPAAKTATGELTNTTMNKIFQTLKMITGQAFDDGKLAADPMAKISPPRPDTEEREALTPDELMLFLNRLDSELPLDGRVMALYLMACLGLRRGEALGLLDADITGGMCRVHQSLKERDNSIGPTKTSAGVRTLPVPARLQAKVDEWRAVRDSRGWRDSEFLCCNTHGFMMTMQPFQKWWTRNRAKLGCEGMVLHQLRHSNLSMMARHMSVFDLQDYAGWSSIEPAKVYVHRDIESLKNSVDAAWKCTDDVSDAPKTHQTGIYSNRI